jgi:hypothetical protein
MTMKYARPPKITKEYAMNIRRIGPYIPNESDG